MKGRNKLNKHREKRKRKECLNHRKERYDQALDRLIEGKADPEYVSKRWKKLKDIKK